ncbi:MAG: glycosyltransferase family 2 protein [Candidatus Hydrogenedentes bacterium]|nr:glycosyltransferase family 2 protein [Candidatus Hydrogenedentota bacterium]
MTHLSIVVISYNTRDMTIPCIVSALSEAVQYGIQLIVLDNASTDGSATEIRNRFPDLLFIESPTNIGFAAANNLAAKSATGEYLLLLNPDTVVRDHAIDKLVAFADKHADFGIFGGRTVFGDGSLNPKSCWREPSLWGLFCRAIYLDNLFPNSGFFNRDSYGGWKRDSVREVDIVSGCFLLIRREVWEQLGGFAPDFFMYAEDFDLCMRARRQGIRALICPDAQIVHYGGASEPVLQGKMIRLLETKAKLCRKHWSPLRAWFAERLLDLWVIIRMIGYGTLSLVRISARDKYDCWRGVWRERSRWHF